MTLRLEIDESHEWCYLIYYQNINVQENALFINDQTKESVLNFKKPRQFQFQNTLQKSFLQIESKIQK